MKKLVVLDGNALMHRAYHAMRPMGVTDGEAVQAVFGFVSVIITILEAEKPDYFAAGFDTKAKTFRKEKCDTYKAGRVKPADDFYAQIPLMQEFLEKLGILKLEADGFEADDILATVAHKVAPQENLETVIVTSDRDALQLVNKKVCVHDLYGGYKKATIYTPEKVKEKFGVTPEQFVDYKGLIGDNSDNLPGARGIGPKTAAEMLNKYETLENLYAHLEELKEGEQKKLIASRSDVFFTQEMARLRTDTPVEFNLENCRVSEFDAERAIEFLKGLGFKAVTARLYNWAHPPKEIEYPEMMEEKKTEPKKKKGEVSEGQMSLF